MDSDDYEADLRASLEALDEAFFRMSAVRDEAGRIIDFRYEYCNQAALAVIGRRREDVLGRRLLEMFPTHVTNGLFDAYVRVTETGEPLRYEFAFDDAGVTGEFEVVVCRVGDGYVLAGHDITERRTMERELVTVKEQLQTALTSRVAIEQAKGYVSGMTGATLEEAFQAIRRYARNHNQRIGEVAQSVVVGDVDVRSEVERTG